MRQHALACRRWDLRRGDLRLGRRRCGGRICYCLSGIGYMMGAVEQLTGAAVTVEELTCQCRSDPGCFFDVKWDER